MEQWTHRSETGEQATVRFIDQALQFVETKDIPKAFAVHAQKIDLVYAASRGDHELFPHLVRACEQMIDYSRPRAEFFKVPIVHAGYQRLYLHYEAIGDYENALAIASDALNGGWLGDWQRRVLRCQKKLAA